MRKLSLTLAALSIAAGAAAVVADATAPGKSGLIAFRRYFNDAHSASAIFTIKADGTGERRLTHAPAGTFDDQPDWAPDGSLLAFSRCPTNNGACAVFTMRPDGSQVKRLSPPCPPGSEPPACEDNANVSFSPDGRQLVFTRASGNVKPDRLVENIIQHSAIVVMDRNGAHRRVIVQAAPYSADLNWPQFSPDGSRLVYERANSSRNKPAGKRALFVVDVASRLQRRITPWVLNAGDNPDWSPDGKWILFRSHVDDGGVSNVYVIHPDGSGMKRLTSFTKPGNVLASSSFSPDGKQIVLASAGVGGNADVYVMHADGSDMHPVTRTRLWDSAPDWGPAS